jgi:hypothetical protein
VELDVWNQTIVIYLKKLKLKVLHESKGITKWVRIERVSSYFSL